MMLRLEGNEVETAYGGAAAIAATADFRPDIVLMDIGMPKVDGYAAARAIRERRGGGETCSDRADGLGRRRDRPPLGRGGIRSPSRQAGGDDRSGIDAGVAVSGIAAIEGNVVAPPWACPVPCIGT